MHAVVLDACVLFPNVLRDAMLTLAERELFRPLWSDAILGEVRDNVIAKRNVDPAAFDRTLALMNASFDGALVADWQPLVAGLELPDPDDRHVLAVAIAGGAQTIVTFNLVDFRLSNSSATTSTQCIPMRSCSINWTSHPAGCSAHLPSRRNDFATRRWISADYLPVSNGAECPSSPRRSVAWRCDHGIVEPGMDT